SPTGREWSPPSANSSISSNPSTTRSRMREASSRPEGVQTGDPPGSGTARGVPTPTPSYPRRMGVHRYRLGDVAPGAPYYANLASIPVIPRHRRLDYYDMVLIMG